MMPRAWMRALPAHSFLAHGSLRATFQTRALMAAALLVLPLSDKVLRCVLYKVLLAVRCMYANLRHPVHAYRKLSDNSRSSMRPKSQHQKHSTSSESNTGSPTFDSLIQDRWHRQALAADKASSSCSTFYVV